MDGKYLAFLDEDFCLIELLYNLFYKLMSCTQVLISFSNLTDSLETAVVSLFPLVSSVLTKMIRC